MTSSQPSSIAPIALISPISLEVARRLRPTGIFHLPPAAQPIHSQIDLIVEETSVAPDVVLQDIRRDVSWRVVPKAVGPNIWSVEVRLPSYPTIVRYHFEFPDGTIYLEHIQFDGREKPAYNEWIDRDFQIAVYDPDHMPAEWTRGMIIYQIFPDRFARDESYKVAKPGRPLQAWGIPPEHPPRGRDFFGGNLPGLIAKLDYLADLGVECIYLTPIFTSPSNHRYDAINYHEIDPVLGTEGYFAQLVERAHQLGLRVVLDAVLNHCSDRSVYFNDARKSRLSPYFHWFTFKRWPDEYEGWVGHRHMPEFVECPDVEDFFLGQQGVIAHWLQHKIDGYRTDVTPWVTEEFWRRFHSAVKAINPEAYLVSEEWENASHYFLGDTFDATMNYRFAWALHGFLAHDKLSVSQFDDRLRVWMRDTPPPALLSQMNLVDSHDTLRILTSCGGDKRRVKQIAAFQFAFPGSPMIYYGDEAGLTGDYAESGRRTFPWDHIDEELHSFYKHALHTRKQYPMLRLGSVETVAMDDSRCLYAFVRRFEGKSLYAAFNASDSPAEITIPLLPEEAGTWIDVLNDHPQVNAQDGKLVILMQPRGAAWYVQK